MTTATNTTTNNVDSGDRGADYKIMTDGNGTVTTTSSPPITSVAIPSNTNNISTFKVSVHGNVGGPSSSSTDLESSCDNSSNNKIPYYKSQYAMPTEFEPLRSSPNNQKLWCKFWNDIGNVESKRTSSVVITTCCLIGGILILLQNINRYSQWWVKEKKDTSQEGGYDNVDNGQHYGTLYIIEKRIIFIILMVLGIAVFGYGVYMSCKVNDAREGYKPLFVDVCNTYNPQFQQLGYKVSYHEEMSSNNTALLQSPDSIVGIITFQRLNDKGSSVNDGKKNDATSMV